MKWGGKSVDGVDANELSQVSIWLILLAFLFIWFFIEFPFSIWGFISFAIAIILWVMAGCSALVGYLLKSLKGDKNDGKN